MDSSPNQASAPAAMSAQPLMEDGAGFDDYQFDLPPLGVIVEELPKLDWSGKSNEQIVSCPRAGMSWAPAELRKPRPLYGYPPGCVNGAAGGTHPDAAGAA